MRNRGQPPTFWEAVSVQVATLATVLAAATVAGFVAIIPEFSQTGHFANDKTLRILVTVLATLSLVAYITGFLLGLSAILDDIGEKQKASVQYAIYGVMVQGGFASAAAILISLTLLVQELAG